MPLGAPSKYRETYCNEVITHCATGASLTSFAAEIGVCRDTISEWCAVHPAFSVSVKKAKAKCAAWWEAKARNGVTGDKDVNPTLAIFGLKNMAPDDWADTVKNEHSGPGGKPIETVNVGLDAAKLSSEALREIIAARTAD